MDAKSIKLYIITPWYNVFAGGAEVLARNLAEQSAERKIQTEVLTTCVLTPEDSWWKDSLKPGVQKIGNVTVRRFSVNNTGEYEYNLAQNRALMGQELSEKDKETLYTCGINSDDLVEHVAGLPDDSLIITIPYYQSLAYNVIKKNRGKVYLMPCFHNEDRFYWNQVKDMLLYSRGIYFLSEPEKELAIRTYGKVLGEKIIEAPVTGAGIERSEAQSLVENLPKKYVLYVGRKDRGKGIVELLAYHSQMKRDIPLVLVGGGDRGLVPENSRIIDYGFVTEEEKNYIIKNAACMVNLSNNESFSFVIMEAWLNSIPVIVSGRCDVTKHHVELSKGGLIIKNANEYEAALNAILENKEIGRSMGTRGKKYVMDNYSWDHVIANIIMEHRGKL
ncbi:MAG: glycosyltransferase family 4 protein [Eubacteriales bacterium]